MSARHPALSNPGLTRVIELLKGATEVLRRSEAWYAARDQYIRHALKGDTDWASWDMDRSAELLVAIQQAMTLPPEAFKATVTRLIAQRIQDAARGHADTMERNGRLYEIEQDPQGRRGTLA